MAVELEESEGGNVITVRLSGKLHREDYKRFVPAVERAIQVAGSIRLLVEMHGFQGWTTGALWEDIRFASRNFTGIERLAVVGDARWEKRMVAFCRPFTAAEIRYFDAAAVDEAREWVTEG